MTQRNTVITEVTVNGPRRVVWAYITDQYNLRRLIENTLDAGVVFDNTADPYEGEQNKPVFRSYISGDDLLLSAKGCSVALRVAESQGKTRIVAAASSEDSAVIMPTKSQLDALINHARRDIETGAGGLEPAPMGDRPVPEIEEVPSGEGMSLPREHLPRKTKTDRKKAEKDSKSKGWVIALAAVVVVALLAVLILPMLKDKPATAPPSGYADKVTPDNVLSILLGSSESEVKALLGTSGVSHENGRLYVGTANKGETYGIRALVHYGADGADRITYLNTDQCTVPGTFDYPGEYNALGSLKDVEAALGRPASMVRMYQVDGADITEIHFGYLDPFFNFNSAWRGEYVLVQDKTNSSAKVQYWAGTDGSDPLVLPALEGTPVANQYNDYTEFLNDKYSFEKSLFMLNGYSRGDVRDLFGEYELYSTDAGVALNLLDSEEKLDDGTPVYRMSFGFDSRGRFVMSSYTNLRILNRQGMLDDSKYAEVTRGMSYGEIRDLMGILPTAVVIDQNYFTLCYGRHIDTENFEEQFEFMVKFDIQNNYAQTLWDNTARV